MSRLNLVAVVALLLCVVAGCEGPALEVVLLLDRGPGAPDTSGVRSLEVRVLEETLAVTIDPTAQTPLAFKQSPPEQPVAVHVAACTSETCAVASAAFIGCSGLELSADHDPNVAIRALLHAPGSALADECLLLP